MIHKVLIAGGGTGGHLFPGIAVVEELRRRLPRLEVLFVGTERGLEARLLPAMGERLETLDVRPLAGRAGAELLRSAVSLPRALVQAGKLVRSFDPQLAIGLGGYAAGPALLVAATLRVPTALLEQNVHLGLTNRLLARSVGRAYLTHPEAAGQFGERARVLGNPVRRAFVEAARRVRHDPAGVEARSRSVLVMGGSQGSRSLNELVPQALAQAGVGQLGIEVVHQTGQAMVEQVSARYRALGVPARVLAFIDDVARAYEQAALVIGRAGGSTLAELCAVGRASILVPYPHAAEDDQAKNALALQRQGATVAVFERELTAELLSGHVRALLTDPTRRRMMADAARRMGRPDAAAAIVDDLLAWLGVPTEAAPEPDGGPAGATDAGGQEDPSQAASPAGEPIRRRTKVKRAALRVRPVSSHPAAASR